MFSQRGSAYSNMVSLNVSVPLQWDQKNRQDRELAARLATGRTDARRARGEPRARTWRRCARCCRSGRATASGSSATTAR